MQTVYADVLIVLNIYVNFFLLRITARLTRTPLRTGRCAAAAVWGSLFSLLILAPELSPPLLTLIRLTAAVSIVLAAFGLRGLRRTALNTAAFFSANLILGGAVYAVYSWLRPDFVAVGNGFFYVDFSLLILLLTTAGLYLIVSLGSRLLGRSPPDSGCWRVVIRCRDKVISLEGLADTGNLLTDFFTGAAVIICGRELFQELTGVSPDSGTLPRGFRLLPCSTVSDSGVIPVFRPDEVLIVNTLTGDRKPADALIGFGSCGRKAIFNPRLMK